MEAQIRRQRQPGGQTTGYQIYLETLQQQGA
jgi:hypothetical protein